MGKIIYLMGKSSTGKDTLFKRLLENPPCALQTVVPYTTRPIRDGESQGVEYFFTDEEGYQKLKNDGKLIEERAYHTCHGLWRYFTVDDGQIDLSKENYAMIGTLEAYEKLKVYFGVQNLCPVLVELDDGERLQRALNRERTQEHPKFQEMCRRFLADAEDFSEDKIAAAGINRRFYNDDLERCFAEIREYVLENVCNAQEMNTVSGD